MEEQKHKQKKTRKEKDRQKEEATQFSGRGSRIAASGAGQPSSSALAFEKIFGLLQRNRWQSALQTIDVFCGSPAFATASGVGPSLLHQFLSLSATSSAATSTPTTAKNVSFSDWLVFERAYCLYRLNRYHEALKLIQFRTSLLSKTSATAKQSPLHSPPDDESLKFRHLEAQLHYRLGDYQRSYEIYGELLTADSENAMLMTNLVSACASMDRDPLPELPCTVTNAAGDTYELAFNLACYFLEMERLDDADKFLDIAEQLCEEELRETGGDLTEEDLRRNAELAAVRIQHAYLLQRRGNVQEASAAYEAFLAAHSEGSQDVDVTLFAVARNNLMALSPKGQSLSDALKRIDIAAKESLRHKLSRKQAIGLAANRCLMLLDTGKMDECKRELTAAASKYRGARKIKLATVAMLYREGRWEKCDSLLRRHESTAADQLSRLGLAYVRLNRKDYVTAGQLLRENSPKTLEALWTLVTVLLRSRDVDGAMSCIESVIDSWRQTNTEEAQRIVRALLYAYGDLCMAEGRYREAAKQYREVLHSFDSTDVRAVVGLVKSAIATGEMEVATQYSESLKRHLPRQQILMLDPDELEASELPAAYKGRSKQTSSPDGASSSQRVAADVKKKRRKPRYPKGFDINNPGPPPDPERWLPRHERSSYKKAGKRKQQLGRGPQGSIPTSDAAFRAAGPTTKHSEAAQDTTTRQKMSGRRKRR